MTGHADTGATDSRSPDLIAIMPTTKPRPILPPSRGATRKRHRMRCSKCTRRFTLKRHPDQYVRAVRCRHCRSLNVYSCEQARRRELRRQDTCHCYHYPFPHRAGTLAMCEQAPREPTEEDFVSYQRVVATPRSAFC